VLEARASDRSVWTKGTELGDAQSVFSSPTNLFKNMSLLPFLTALLTDAHLLVIGTKCNFYNTRPKRFYWKSSPPCPTVCLLTRCILVEGVGCDGTHHQLENFLRHGNQILFEYVDGLWSVNTDTVSDNLRVGE
jgi:hypothetical protein